MVYYPAGLGLKYNHMDQLTLYSPTVNITLETEFEASQTFLIAINSHDNIKLGD